MIYRQEADSFFTIVAPAAVLGPVLVIVAASGFIRAMVALPLFIVLFVLTYAACVRAAALILRNLAPDPAAAWIDALRSLPPALTTAAIPSLGLIVAIGAAISIAGDGMPLVAFGVAAAGGVAFAHWLLRHAYDESLVLAHELPPHEAQRVGPLLACLQERWTPSLLAWLGLPLAAGGAIAWLAAELLAPAVGGALFVLAVAAWMPLAALSLTIDCDRLLAEATEPAQRRSTNSAAG